MTDILDDKKTLTVYRASAGSGKTFRLAVEYVKLLLRNPTCYRNILAVTFTNKATEEMKGRILSTLYGLYKKQKNTKAYMNKIVEETGLNEAYISEKAGEALFNILHDYQYFQVQTIDKFFQHIFRNLARELNLSSNLRIEIRDKDILQFAVDDMIDSLRTDDKEFKWIVEFMMDKINENKQWRIINDIKQFGETIFKDFYKEKQKAIDEVMTRPDFFMNFTTNLRKQRNAMVKELEDKAKTFLRIVEEHGFDIEDFKGKKSSICSYFNKIANNIINDGIRNKTVEKCLSSTDEWIGPKTRRKDELKRLVEEQLLPMLQDMEQIRPGYNRFCLTADATLSHINYLRLLGSIKQHVKEVNNDNNRFLLSDTQGMLQKLIGDNDTPFVFEKTGTRLHHVMIDEFQDTSRLQWRNFKLLLKNCMDNGYENLIVGDIKQSIYRWRDGDWRLLAGLEKEFGQPSPVDIKGLNDNRRSRGRIVTFNNLFFKSAAQKMCETLPSQAAQLVADAYADVQQEIPDGSHLDGHVVVKIFPKKTKEPTVLDYLEEQIDDLLGNGVPAKEIGILARRNKDISFIARHFQLKRPEWKMVSSIAFRLDFSLGVRTIINAMHLLENPDDMLRLPVLAKTYQKDILGKETDDDTLFLDCDNYMSLLPEGYREPENRQTLRTLPLIDLAERLYQLFEIERIKGQDAYITTFFDAVTDYVKTEIATLGVFLTAWEEQISQQTIQSDDVDGIRLLTIHKSKGLEVPTLFIPFCDWQLERNSILWCQKPNQPPFDQLPIVPVNYGKRLLQTYYQPDYEEEHLQNMMDQLNMLYVGQTRAKDRLYIYGRGADSRAISPFVSDVVKDIAEDSLLAGCQLTTDEKTKELYFEFGERYPLETCGEKKEDKEVNVFSQPPIVIDAPLVAYDCHATFRQSGQSEQFTQPDMGAEDARQQEYIQTGCLLHEVLSRIHTTDDIPGVLNAMMSEGLVSTPLQTKRLHNLLLKRLSDPRAAEWFDPHWQVYTECRMLSKAKGEQKHTELRPDRVIADAERTIVIDFKFGKYNSEHRSQVEHYMEWLRQMGRQHVEGKLWYVYSNEIVDI